ncbi:MAG TPA: hypothetical protein VLK88_17700, partial [Gemmatimonadales bacterium]|nr:hypothetical protein [Gemmatimonadales bacterium]
MRWLALFARIIGWLLTPLVVWAASFLGAWLATWFATGIAAPRAGLYTTLRLTSAAASCAALSCSGSDATASRN